MDFNPEQRNILEASYEEYQKIQDVLLEESSFHSDEENQIVILKVDYCLQFLLLQIAVSDRKITEQERLFIKTFTNHLEDQNQEKPGYRRFLKYVSLETWDKYQEKYYSDASLQLLKDCLVAYFRDTEGAWLQILDCFEKVCKGLISIDDEGRDKGSSCFSEIFLPFDSLCLDDEILIDGKSKLREVLSELDSLIGLKGVKEEVLSRMNMIQVNRVRMKNGIEPLKVTMHMVFAGNPGTGKTTVANIVARIYKELGVLPKGQLVEKRRENLVGQYIGHTAPLVEAAVQEARGGILFIDDAYSLSDSGYKNDFGREAIDTLVPLMEKYREELVVIIAGYPDKMQEFMDMNEGLRSRFPSRSWIYFSDYSPEEMQMIFDKMLAENHYILSHDARDKLMKIWEHSQSVKDFGNGRGVRNVLDEVITRQVNRIASLGVQVDKDELVTIKSCDIPEPEGSNEVIQRNIGFKMYPVF